MLSLCRQRDQLSPPSFLQSCNMHGIRALLKLHSKFQKLYFLFLRSFKFQNDFRFSNCCTVYKVWSSDINTKILNGSESCDKPICIDLYRNCSQIFIAVHCSVITSMILMQFYQIIPSWLQENGGTWSHWSTSCVSGSITRTRNCAQGLPCGVGLPLEKKECGRHILQCVSLRFFCTSSEW